MGKKIVLFAFQGELMCFLHVMLNGLDMKKRGFDVQVVIEGQATKLIKTFHDGGKDLPFLNIWTEFKAAGLIHAVCKSCATKMGSIREAELEHLPIVGDMSGHPAMAPYLDAGYEIISF